MRSREIIRRLEEDGWFEVRQRGSHKIFQHSTKSGNVVVPDHRGDMPRGTERSIWRQAGLLPRPQEESAEEQEDEQSETNG